MRPGRQNPTRLADLAPENDPAKVAHLIQAVRQAPDEPLPLVKWRIQNTLRRRTAWNRRGLRLALVGALVFLAGGIVGAIAGPLLGARRRSAPLQPVVNSSPAQAAHHSHRRVPAQAIPLPPTDEPPVATQAPALRAPAAPTETKPAVFLEASAKPKAEGAPVASIGSRRRWGCIRRPWREARKLRGQRRRLCRHHRPPLPSPEPSPIPAGRIAMKDPPNVPAREQNPASEESGRICRVSPVRRQARCCGRRRPLSAWRRLLTNMPC